jgi:hypothetical protein
MASLAKRLPSCLAACKATANDMDRMCHEESPYALKKTQVRAEKATVFVTSKTFLHTSEV